MARSTASCAVAIVQRREDNSVRTNIGEVARLPRPSTPPRGVVGRGSLANTGESPCSRTVVQTCTGGLQRKCPRASVRANIGSPYTSPVGHPKIGGVQPWTCTDRRRTARGRGGAVRIVFGGDSDRSPRPTAVWMDFVVCVEVCGLCSVYVYNFDVSLDPRMFLFEGFSVCGAVAVQR